MCLIFLSLQHHPTYKLIVAGNRDEFYHRRTAAADYWNDHPNVLAGRDLEAGGTWLGMTTSGRISMLTNYRDLKSIKSGAPSRGHLVSDFLVGDSEPSTYLQHLEQKGAAYNGFNLIVGTLDELWYYSNYGGPAIRLTGGFYGISNHLLETPWPKVVNGKRAMEQVFRQPVIDPEEVFRVLYNDERAPDDLLPDTGLTPERESALSSMFIKTDNYGSRCSTLLLVDRVNNVLFAERTFDMVTFSHQTRTFHLSL
jgi:uncharacterized protein with NRDE domain